MTSEDYPDRIWLGRALYGCCSGWVREPPVGSGYAADVAFGSVASGVALGRDAREISLVLPLTALILSRRTRLLRRNCDCRNPSQPAT